METARKYMHQTIHDAEVVWVKIPTYKNKEGEDCPLSEEELVEKAWIDTINNLFPIIESLGYQRGKGLTWKNNLYSVRIEPTYDFEGLLIYMESLYYDAWRYDEVRLHQIANQKHQEYYSQLVDVIIKSGMFDISTSTKKYTSANVI